MFSYLSTDVFFFCQTLAYSKNENKTKLQVLPIGVKLMTSDALSLSNKRLVGAKDIKLDLCDKHPAYIVGLLLF